MLDDQITITAPAIADEVAYLPTAQMLTHARQFPSPLFVYTFLVGYLQCLLNITLSLTV